MPWFKVDDTFAFHPKVMRAGNQAIGLWVRAGCWSSATLTDGKVPADVLKLLGAKPATVDALVQTGLWRRNGDGIKFHDWEQYQPTASDVKRKKAAESEAGSIGNHRRWHVGRGKVPNPTECKHCREGDTE